MENKRTYHALANDVAIVEEKAANRDHWSTLKNTGYTGELENMH